MSWRHGHWAVEHNLPLGQIERAEVGRSVAAGDVLATGTRIGVAQRIKVGERLRLNSKQVPGAIRVSVGEQVARGSVLARRSGIFSQTIRSSVEGRIVHQGTNGDLYLTQALDPTERWRVTATLDGTVTRSDDSVVSVEGTAWCLAGLAAYGPDAVGEINVAVDAPMDELSPSQVDVRQRAAIVFGGARITAESLTKAHACGVAGLVSGAVPATALRAVYGAQAGACGGPTIEDRPTVLCLVGFGSARVPLSLFRPLVGFSGARAAIHTRSARLFVFAPSDSIEASVGVESLILSGDHGSVQPFEEQFELAGRVRFPSEIEVEAFTTRDGPVPLANVLPFDSER